MVWKVYLTCGTFLGYNCVEISWESELRFFNLKFSEFENSNFARKWVFHVLVIKGEGGGKMGFSGTFWPQKLKYINFVIFKSLKFKFGTNLKIQISRQIFFEYFRGEKRISGAKWDAGVLFDPILKNMLIFCT